MNQVQLPDVPHVVLGEWGGCRIRVGIITSNEPKRIHFSPDAEGLTFVHCLKGGLVVTHGDGETGVPEGWCGMFALYYKAGIRSNAPVSMTSIVRVGENDRRPVYVVSPPQPFSDWPGTDAVTPRKLITLGDFLRYECLSLSQGTQLTIGEPRFASSIIVVNGEVTSDAGSGSVITPKGFTPGYLALAYGQVTCLSVTSEQATVIVLTEPDVATRKKCMEQ